MEPISAVAEAVLSVAGEEGWGNRQFRQMCPSKQAASHQEGEGSCLGLPGETTEPWARQQRPADGTSAVPPPSPTTERLHWAPCPMERGATLSTHSLRGLYLPHMCAHLSPAASTLQLLWVHFLPQPAPPHCRLLPPLRASPPPASLRTSLAVLNGDSSRRGTPLSWDLSHQLTSSDQAGSG